MSASSVSGPLSLLMLLAVSPVTLAHPPSAIAVTDDGKVYYTDAQEGVFRLNGADQPVRVTREAMHWMALDRDGAFAKAPDSFGEWFGRITPRGEKPTLVSCSDFPCTIGRDGSLYFPKMHQLAIVRRTPAGEESVFVEAADYGLDLNRHWGVNGITCGPDGTLYLVALDSLNPEEGTGEHMLYGVDSEGKVRELASGFANNLASEDQRHPEVRPQYCRGMAANDKGDVYIAVTGSRCVLKITSGAEPSVVPRAERPWSPTGVALHDGSVYVLEYNDEKPVKNREWPLRVRKVTSQGNSKTLVTVRAD